MTLPQQDREPNHLLDFKDTLSQVTDLARNKRNETSLKFMSPFRGTVAASDFSSILANLNRASERFTTEAIERLLPDTTDLTGATAELRTFSLLNPDLEIGTSKFRTAFETFTKKTGKVETISGLVNEVLDGFTSLEGLSTSDKTKVKSELFDLGFNSDTPPSWFKEFIEAEKRQTLLPEVIQEEWIKYRDKILEEGGGLDFDNL